MTDASPQSMTPAKTDRRKLRVAYADVPPGYVEGVLKHVEHLYDIELTRDRDADYVFHSCDGFDVLKYPGVRIFITGENVTPNFAISDYALAFDKLDFGDRYLWTPLFKCFKRPDNPFLSRPDPDTVLAAKTGFCAYVMSNTTNSDDARVRIFDLLNEYKRVSSGGRWRNNVGGPVKDKLAFQREHKFAIAFENCSYPGYLTEKFFDAVAADTIPIYWGDPDIGSLFNPKAFINCHDFPSLEAVVERVREIDNDDNLYRAMLTQPWYVDGSEPECLRDETFTRFLSHIFDQPLEAAYRRNRGRWGIKWEQHLYDMYHRPWVQAFKNLRKGWRRLYHTVMPYRKRF